MPTAAPFFRASLYLRSTLSDCDNPSHPQESMEIEEEIGSKNDERITNRNYFRNLVSRDELHGIASAFITTINRNKNQNVHRSNQSHQLFFK